MIEVIHTRRAMATRFEVALVGRDRDHLDSVALAALEEVARVETVLSRYDPSAELARINREASHAPTLVSWEMARVLTRCQEFHQATGGWFDPCAGHGRFGCDVLFDSDQRRIRLGHSETRLDFGGLGKGYAVDRAAELIEGFGVDRFLIHGGTSSIRARGQQASGQPWRVALRAARPNLREVEAAILTLRNQSLSCSANHDPGDHDPEDPNAAAVTRDPTTGEAVPSGLVVAVLANSALVAEAWSTAFLAMGPSRFGEIPLPAGITIGWNDARDGKTIPVWRWRTSE